jgi:hypothetical protein
MKINENNEAFPPYKYFTDVEEKFLNFKPRCRVLPARHFNDPQMHFSLQRKYEPGVVTVHDNPYAPDHGLFTRSARLPESTNQLLVSVSKLGLVHRLVDALGEIIHNVPSHSLSGDCVAEASGSWLNCGNVMMQAPP